MQSECYEARWNCVSLVIGWVHLHENDPEKYMAVFSGLSDDYPSPHVRVSKRTVYGHWLLIYRFPASSSWAPINIQGLGAGDVDRGQVIWREAEGGKVQEQSRERRCICAACRFVATHREKNAYGKLQESPMWLWSTSIDFVMIFIFVQYRSAVG